jgi:hypothetical protein
MTLLAVSDESVRIRIDVAAGGCGTPLEGIRTAVDAAIRDAAPDLQQVEVEAATRGSAPPTLIQLTRR